MGSKLQDSESEELDVFSLALGRRSGPPPQTKLPFSPLTERDGQYVLPYSM